MNFEPTDTQNAIREGVAALCARFDDAWWLARDEAASFPHEFYDAVAQAGFLGICIPEEYGGAGLGITEAAIMMETISGSGAGMSGASAVHMNIFGLNPVVVFGTAAQKARFLPPLVAGREKACFGVTEPTTGLDTTRLKTRAEKRGDRYVVNGQKVWISTAQVADRILLLARTTPIEQSVTVGLPPVRTCSSARSQSVTVPAPSSATTTVQPVRSLSSGASAPGPAERALASRSGTLASAPECVVEPRRPRIVGDPPVRISTVGPPSDPIAQSSIVPRPSFATRTVLAPAPAKEQPETLGSAPDSMTSA